MPKREYLKNVARCLTIPPYICLSRTYQKISQVSWRILVGSDDVLPGVSDV